MNRIGIILIGFNRPQCLSRLLSSIDKLRPGKFDYSLIISIDGGGDSKCASIANEYTFELGEKEVILHSENLGLKNHVICCGDLSSRFDAVLILEDDLFLSPIALHYLEQALLFYSDAEKIAGISLYSHAYNETAERPFWPSPDGFDVFFMQIPSSSGQVWTKKQWSDFKRWLNNDGYSDKLDSLLPDNVQEWPDSSWKKIFMAYLIDQEKYFVYPRTSFSTNFGEAGTHDKRNVHRHQVILSTQSHGEARFAELDNSNSIYDSYCEAHRDILSRKATLPNDYPLTVDLYGRKDLHGQQGYIVTSQQSNITPVKTYGRRLKPIELNITLDIPGRDLYLYRVKQQDEARFDKSPVRVSSHEDLDYWYALKSVLIWPIIQKYQESVMNGTTYRIGKLIYYPAKKLRELFRR